MIWIVVGAVVLLAIWFLIRPPALEPVDRYFRQAETGELTDDVEDKLEMLERVLAKDPSDFSDFRDFVRDGVKFVHSFTVYALTSLAFSDRKRRERMGVLIDKLIHRMHFPICWDDFVTEGLGLWPFEGVNIMYTGHLFLMMLCHYLVTGDTKYENQMHYLAKTIVAAMRQNHFKGVVCQPQNYFTECNTINVYALKLYDVFYGTNHDADIAAWWRWAKEHMQDPTSSVFYEKYHPATEYLHRSQVGFNNAWIAMFMPVFDPDHAQEFYRSFRAQFVRKFLWYSWATVFPRDHIRELDRHCSLWQRLKHRIPDGKSTLMAFFAAREFGDKEAWYGMARLMAKAPIVRVDSRIRFGVITVRVRGNPAAQLSVFFAKAGELGLKRLLDVAQVEGVRRPVSYEMSDPAKLGLPLPPDVEKLVPAIWSGSATPDPAGPCH